MTGSKMVGEGEIGKIDKVVKGGTVYVWCNKMQRNMQRKMSWKMLDGVNHMACAL